MATIAHFDVAADEPERAKKFYEQLFGWKIAKPPGPMDYYLIETRDASGKPGVGGGMGKRMLPEQKITNYVGVDSVDEYSKKVVELGGEVVQEKMAVPGFGYLANCQDTEGNPFGLWQDDKDAK